jgi:methionyl-tRNA formyltransferase
MSRVVIAGGRNLGPALLRQIASDPRNQVVGAVCRTDDTGVDGVFPSLRRCATELGIPCLQPACVSSPESLEDLAGYDADILVSAMYNQIFRANVIDLFDRRLGIINIHYAPLPRYSGFWPEMWAIWNDEKTFAVTIHRVDAGVDTGNIIDQGWFAIDEDETRRSLYLKCDRAALELVGRLCPLLLQRKSEGSPQDARARTYCRRKLPNDGYIDPDWDYRTISRFIRATTFHPFVGAKFRLGDTVFSVIENDVEFFKPYQLSQE